jgi:hypothetical protein
MEEGRRAGNINNEDEEKDIEIRISRYVNQYK